MKIDKSMHKRVSLITSAALVVLSMAPQHARGQANNRVTQGTSRPVAQPQPAPTPTQTRTTSSGDVPRSTFIQSMDAEFRKRDLDGDGKITRAEVEQAERNEAISKAQAQNRALFASIDSDRNGLLSPGEFATLVRNIPTPDVSEQMRRFDSNRDQVISLVEYRTATLLNFDGLDTDKDGVVTERELAASNPPTAPQVGR